jgi:RNA polymerase sigma factor (sigma-70 family)
MSENLTLSQRLDSSRTLVERMDALAELALSGQTKIGAFLRKRGITDPDILSDLIGETWVQVTDIIAEGRYNDRGKDPMAFVFTVTHNILRHYVGRDRRLKGQVVTLDDTIDTSYTEDWGQLEDIEDSIDRAILYQEVLGRLNSDGDRNVAELWWQDNSPPQIAARSQLNIKTVRASLKRIAEEVRLVRAL